MTMNTRAVVSVLLLCAVFVAGSEYLATWIEGPDGEMPDLAFQSQIQDSKGNIWLFGGTKNDYASKHYNHVWKLDVRNNYTWSAIQSWPVNDTGNNPPQRGMDGPNYRPAARHNALIWIDRNDNLWIYGGTNDSWLTFFADLWMFNTTSSQWKFIHESIPTTEWGTKGTGVYNVTMPGENSGAVTWTNFASNELWFIAGGDEQWRSDVWKYSVDSGIWTWMAGPKELNLARTEGIEQGVWYNDNQVNCPAAWAASFTVDPSGDIWFHGGNLPPNWAMNNELWRFRPSTLQWMWVSGNGTNQKTNVAEGQVQPGASDAGTMAYIGNGMILYWLGYSYQKNWYSDQLFSYNTSSNEWKFISGSLNETYMPPQYSKFRQADAGNYPGTRGELSGISLGSLWIVRGSYDWYTPEQHRDTFVFSVDICQNDLNPCDTNAKCTAYTGYADCACNTGYEGDGYTCTAVSAPTSSSSPAASAPSGSKSPSSKTSAGQIYNWISLTLVASVVLFHLL